MWDETLVSRAEYDRKRAEIADLVDELEAKQREIDRRRHEEHQLRHERQIAHQSSESWAELAGQLYDELLERHNPDCSSMVPSVDSGTFQVSESLDCDCMDVFRALWARLAGDWADDSGDEG